jgi:hypothetical protein
VEYQYAAPSNHILLTGPGVIIDMPENAFLSAPSAVFEIQCDSLDAECCLSSLLPVDQKAFDV